MGVALIIPLLNSCFLAQLGSGPLDKAVGLSLNQTAGPVATWGPALLRVRVRKGTFRTGMVTHKWRIKVFCLLANRRGLGGSPPGIV